jgi:TetR/AcrR family transcriptional repressor of nem operon
MQERTDGRRGRGRPLEFDRDEAINVAIDEFWRRGFQAVSITDLADAMSITRTSFYNSFGDRESIFREALEVYRETAPDVELRNVEPGAPVGPVIMHVFREICRVRTRDPERRGCLIVNAVGEIQELDDDSKKYLEETLLASKRVFQRLLLQAGEHREIPPVDDVKAAGGVFLAFLLGVNSLSKVMRTERELWAMCRDFLASYGFVEKKPGK